MSEYKTQAARDVETMIGRSKFMTRSYADYIERNTLEKVAKRPEWASYYMTRKLGDALAGNDGI